MLFSNHFFDFIYLGPKNILIAILISIYKKNNEKNLILTYSKGKERYIICVFLNLLKVLLNLTIYKI